MKQIQNITLQQPACREAGSVIVSSSNATSFCTFQLESYLGLCIRSIETKECHNIDGCCQDWGIASSNYAGFTLVALYVKVFFIILILLRVCFKFDIGIFVQIFFKVTQSHFMCKVLLESVPLNSLP